jgi:photosystem II stability/assembly factor-like uncharacterized protein
MKIFNKSFFKVLLLVIIFQAGLFPQQNNNAWKWWLKNQPGIRFLAAAVCFNNLLLAGGEGSTLFEVTSGKVFCNLGLGPEIDIVSIVYDQINNDVLVLCRDNFTGESYLYSVSALKTVIRLATFFQSLYFVKVYNNMTIVGGEGTLQTSTNRKDFTEHAQNFDLNEFKDIAYSASKANYVLFGAPKDANTNGIRITKQFGVSNIPPKWGWVILAKFDKAAEAKIFPSSNSLNKNLQIESIFAFGYQAATNSNIVCRSTDGGESWDSVFAAPQNQGIRSLSAGSNDNVIVGVTDYGGGSGEELYYTKNGGDTWVKGKDSINNYIYSITHVSADSAYALGAKGLVLLTTDGGENWTQISEDHPSVSAIYFPSPSVGYADGGNGKLYKTSDAGENWNVVNDSSSGGSLYFIDDMTGFNAGPKLMKTTDGGVHWNELNTGVSAYAFRDVYFVNNNLGFATYSDFSTGDGVIKTTDGGMTWDSLTFKNNKHDKQYVYFADENLGFVSGYSTLYRTTDGGDNWDTLTVASGSTPGYYEESNSNVTFINSTTGFFGRKGHIFKTIDRGDTWTDAPIDNHTMPTQIQFVSDSIGYFISATDTFGVHSHILYKTTDGGNSWLDLTNELPTAGIWSLFFSDENTGYLAGSTGILKTTSGGETITSVKEIYNASIPSGYKLYQNYPNPFNPTTKIKYSIPRVGTSLMKFVQLKVYDILGREVKTLVNKEQQPGNYEIEFNASIFSSGVYFYQLKVDNLINTKKMILLK